MVRKLCDLPRADIPIPPEHEKALQLLRELKALAIEPEQESTNQNLGLKRAKPEEHNFFKGCSVRRIGERKIGTLNGFTEVKGTRFAMVKFPHTKQRHTHYPTPIRLSNLEIVHE